MDNGVMCNARLIYSAFDCIYGIWNCNGYTQICLNL